MSPELTWITVLLEVTALIGGWWKSDLMKASLMVQLMALFLIRFERFRGIHIIISTWAQYQIRTLTFIDIVSLSF
jgi:hypothetical protein